MANSPIQSMSRDEKRWFAHAIAGMICADGAVDASELAYLKEAVGFLEDEAEINALVKTVKSKQMPHIEPIRMDNQLAFVLLKHLAGLSITDGKLTNSEVKYFKKLGGLLGFPENILQKIISTARQRMESKLPPVDVTFGDTTAEVGAMELSESHCLFRYAKMISPQTRIMLQFYGRGGKNTEESYDQVVGQVQWSRPSKSDHNTFVVRVEFRQTVKSNHGILQILYPERFKPQKARKELKPTKNSLLGKLVQCHVCGQADIPFWLMRAKSLITQPNIFGITTYTKALSGRDFVDYNIVQVGVCPTCCFASHEIRFFRSEDDPTCPYDAKAMHETWLDRVKERKEKYDKHASGFHDDTRSEEQSVVAYDFAIATHEYLANLESGYEHPRLITSLLMVQAEILMNLGDREAAETNLRKTKDILEPIFSHLEGEVILRSATLLFGIHLYFKENSEVSKYMSFVNDYDRKGPLDPGTSEARTHRIAKEMVNKAYGDRDAYGHDKLKIFHLT